jgi:CRISPR/Cas system-associated exonuclease Cas4 (RecB family)
MVVREMQQETDIGPSTQVPVSNDELGWNWKKPPVGQEPWSAWQKRMGDSDTVRHEFPR